ENVSVAAIESENPSSDQEKAESPSRTPPAKKKKLPPAGENRIDVAVPFISEIHKVTLADGSFHFLGRANEAVANFEGVGIRSAINNASALKGNARVSRVSLREIGRAHV